MLFHVLSVVTAIVNHACTHASSIAACMVTCIEADKLTHARKKHCIFVAHNDALRNR